MHPHYGQAALTAVTGGVYDRDHCRHRKRPVGEKCKVCRPRYFIRHFAGGESEETMRWR
jgi:hypothetical protein